MGTVQFNVKTGLGRVDHSITTANHIMLEILGERSNTDELRPALDLIAVVDTSTSMGSNRKMVNVKGTLELLVKNMSPDDHLTLVEYNSAAHVTMQRTRISNESKPRIHQSIASLFPQDWTNFGAALSVAYSVARQERPDQSSIKRIIFFTDGCPTSGVTEPDKLVELCQQAPQDWRITTMGYGIDSASGADVDLDLLARMARSGKGNFYYMKDAESTAKAFATELGGLVSVVAEHVRVTLTPHKDRIKIKKILEDVEQEVAKDSMTIYIPDLLADETKRLTFAVDCLPQKKNYRPGSNKVADIKIEYLDLASTKFVTHADEASVEYVKRGEESESAIPEISEQIAFVAASRAQKEALEKAGAGNFRDAKKIMEMAIEALRQVGTDRAVKLARGFEETVNTLNDQAAFDRGKSDYTVSMYESSHGRSAGGSFAEEFYTPTLKESITVFIDDLPDTVDFDPDEVTEEVEGIAGDEEDTLTYDVGYYAAKPKVSAKQVIADLIAQKDNKAIMRKYGLSVKGLRSLYQKLVNVGLMSQEQFDQRMGPKNTD